jgi:hypothetical protein
MGLIFVILGLVATWRLAATPLFTTAAGFATLATLAWGASRWLAAGRPEGAPRWLVALGHMSGAMGGFFFFVSLALP